MLIRVVFSLVFVFCGLSAAHAQVAALPFSASCECELKKEFEKPGPGGYLVSSYACNADRLGEVVVYRILLMDLSKDLKNQPAERVQAYSANYYATLKAELEKAGLFVLEQNRHSRKTLEYAQLVKHEGETLPQKTAVFLSGTQSVTLQLTSSSSNAERQFDEFKAGFMLLEK